MIEKLRDSRGWQLLVITSLILIVPLMADINGRIGVLRRMHQERARLSQELNKAQAEREALKAQLEFVASDDYVEHWARVEARMTRSGEVAIIPVYSEQMQQVLSVSEATPYSSDTSPAASEQWHRLFFDDTTTP